jgi:hypothetical protein
MIANSECSDLSAKLGKVVQLVRKGDLTPYVEADIERAFIE